MPQSTSNPTTLSISESYYTYEDITLKLYIYIANTGQFNLLSKTPTTNTDACAQAWESIVRKNSEVNGSFAYVNYLQTFKAYEQLRCDALIINAILSKLFFKIDIDDIAFLKRKGYKLDTTHGDHAFIKSLEQAIIKSASIATRLKMKQNELKQFQGNKDEKKKETSFPSLIANLNLNLGMVESDEILLSKYNEYNKILKARQSDGRNKRG